MIDSGTKCAWMIHESKAVQMYVYNTVTAASMCLGCPEAAQQQISPPEVENNCCEVKSNLQTLKTVDCEVKSNLQTWKTVDCEIKSKLKEKELQI